MASGLRMLLSLFLITSAAAFFGAAPDEGDYRHLYPVTCVVLRVTYPKEILSYALGWLENQNYPKDRIRFIALAEPEKWKEHMKEFYHSITLDLAHENWYEQALKESRRFKCAYALLTTTDVLLEYNAIRNLMALKKVAVSALVKSPSNGHSNGVGLLTPEQFSGEVYFNRPPLLIHLEHQDAGYLTFDEQNLREEVSSKAPIDVFAHSAYSMNIPIYLDNHHYYGMFFDSSHLRMLEYRAELAYFHYSIWAHNNQPAVFSNAIEPWKPKKTKFGFEQIYVINLERRPERRRRVSKTLNMLGFDFTFIDAVDGSQLRAEDMALIHQMPEYLDPYHKRPMKLGEIGCFLSHQKVWLDTVLNNYSRVIVFEDDIRFEPNSTKLLWEIVEDLTDTRKEWDLIYLGRKKNDNEAQEYMERGQRHLASVTYSYWTLGYALSLQGARKLIEARPMENLLALDEFLPIMYDSHPNEQWKAHFPNRNLLAFSVYPLLVQPERYTNEPGYVSDTEDSSLAGPPTTGSILIDQPAATRVEL